MIRIFLSYSMQKLPCKCNALFSTNNAFGCAHFEMQQNSINVVAKKLPPKSARNVCAAQKMGHKDTQWPQM